MTAQIEIVLAAVGDRAPLARMLELYQHDLSDIWDQDLDLHGEYGYDLDRFLHGRDAWPYLFRVDGKLAGFALVDRRVRIPGDDFWMDQFFVLKNHRRRGVASFAAVEVFARHVGRWQVGEMAANHIAQAFWRRTIAAYTRGHYSEEEIYLGWWQGVIQRFSSASDDRA